MSSEAKLEMVELMEGIKDLSMLYGPDSLGDVTVRRIEEYLSINLGRRTLEII